MSRPAENRVRVVVRVLPETAAQISELGAVTLTPGRGIDALAQDGAMAAMKARFIAGCERCGGTAHCAPSINGRVTILCRECYHDQRVVHGDPSCTDRISGTITTSVPTLPAS